ncbi:MAG: hypothetical protein HQL63_04315 [Magnetococcales bacterium]|nr:hypothetical protein [Magnetococcales bacterium]MBF0321846.1 hypothetical protein [Magnetococcales bacterium]
MDNQKEQEEQEVHGIGLLSEHGRFWTERVRRFRSGDPYANEPCGISVHLLPEQGPRSVGHGVGACCHHAAVGSPFDWLFNQKIQRRKSTRGEKRRINKKQEALNLANKNLPGNKKKKTMILKFFFHANSRRITLFMTKHAS